MAWLCEQWNSQPDAGGMLDQDYALITQMTASSNIYRTLKRYRGLRGKEIHSLSVSERRLLRSLMDLDMI